MKLLNREYHIPILSPHDIPVFNGEFFEILRFNISIILRVGMGQDERSKINRPGSPVTEKDVETNISRILGANDVQCRI